LSQVTSSIAHSTPKGFGPTSSDCPTVTRAIRSYSSTEGNELVPPIAAEFGLKVMVGAWINKDPDHNQREIESAIALAKRNSNVNGIVVGNETVFRADQKVEDLIELIKRVKKSSMCQ
jgi:exo-beta-1,3-glucanase (GH17 family)